MPNEINGTVTTSGVVNGEVTPNGVVNGVIGIGKGDKGDKPVKGVDYFTEADKAEWRADLSTEVNTAKDQIIAQGVATLATIPEDYTALANDMDKYVKDRYSTWVSHNLVDGDDSMTVGAIANGAVYPSYTTYKYTDFIPCTSGDSVRGYNKINGAFATIEARWICFYDNNKTYKSGLTNPIAPITIPDGISYFRATYPYNQYRSNYMVTLNYEATEYEEYGDEEIKIVDDFLSEDTSAFIDSLKGNGYGCSLPRSAMKQTVGIAEKFYTDSFITPSKTTYGDVSCGGMVARANDGIAFPNANTETGANGYLWSYYDHKMSIIESDKGKSGYGYARDCKALNLQNCSLLAIGDSTVDHDIMTGRIKSFFAENGAEVTLLGTLGSASDPTNKNEGRAGWKTTDYFTNKAYNGVVNPFWNPSTNTFDFSYYMNQQGYASVDFVIIQLGINDLYWFDDTNIIPTWNNVKAMIDSIRTYSNTIKIILNLPTTPNSDPSAHSIFEPLYRNRIIRYCEYATKKAKEIYSTDAVRVSYCHLIIDPATEIRDNVHPTDDGYRKMGLEVVNQINHWQT